MTASSLLATAQVSHSIEYSSGTALILSRLPGHRLGWLYFLCGLASSVTLASYAYAQRGLVNRLGVTLPRSWFDAVGSAGFVPLLLIAILGSLAALAVRYRRAPAGERNQLRWLLIAAGLLAVSFALVGGPTVALAGNLLGLV